jgi:hypothetical protein
LNSHCRNPGWRHDLALRVVRPWFGPPWPCSFAHPGGNSSDHGSIAEISIPPRPAQYETLPAKLQARGDGCSQSLRLDFGVEIDLNSHCRNPGWRHDLALRVVRPWFAAAAATAAAAAQLDVPTKRTRLSAGGVDMPGMEPVGCSQSLRLDFGVEIDLNSHCRNPGWRHDLALRPRPPPPPLNSTSRRSALVYRPAAWTCPAWNPAGACRAAEARVFGRRAVRVEPSVVVKVSVSTLG